MNDDDGDDEVSRFLVIWMSSEDWIHVADAARWLGVEGGGGKVSDEGFNREGFGKMLLTGSNPMMRLRLLREPISGWVPG